MATVYTLTRTNKKGKSYYVYYCDPFTGKKVHYKTFSKKKEAVSAEARLRVMIENQEFQGLQSRKKKHRPMTFSQVGALCREGWEERVACGKLSPATLEGYLFFLGAIESEFGDKYVWDLNEKMLKEFRLQKAMELSPCSSNRRLFIIKKVLDRAVEEGALMFNPVKSLNYVDESVHCRMQFLTPAQLNKLLKACDATKAKYLRAMVLLGAEHGAAKQEVLDLEWDRIDFEQNTIFFSRTKNGAKRTMKLMPRTKKALLEWREYQLKIRHRKKVEVLEDRYVFCRMDGTKLKGFKSAWSTVRYKAGMKRFHFHDLRHTFGTNLLTAGGDIKDVKDLLGHQDIRSTDRYAHLSLQRKEDIQNKLAEHYGDAQD